MLLISKNVKRSTIAHPQEHTNTHKVLYIMDLQRQINQIPVLKVLGLNPNGVTVKSAK